MHRALAIAALGLLLAVSACDTRPATPEPSPEGTNLAIESTAAVSTAAAAPTTATPLPPAATLTPLPPTATATVEPPTATAEPPTTTPTATAIPPTPTRKPPTATASPTPARGWLGEYYNDVALSGSPHVRDDETIDFEWGTGSPMPGINADNFSVRWTKKLDLPAGGYHFVLRVDDGARLWIDDQLLIDQWHDGWARVYEAHPYLSEGVHAVRVEMYEREGDSAAQLTWEPVEAYPDWKGEYFDNMTLSGEPVVVRNDKVLDLNWGLEAPAPGVPPDNFSVRWERDLYLPRGPHTFFVAVDDGARLWVDGLLIIDEWHDGTAIYSADMTLREGLHTVKMEMYEHLGGAQARMWWDLHTDEPVWKGRYFTNRNLEGAPELVRRDERIDFNWGTGPPAPGLPDDNFSVRWTRKAEFTAGYYQFCATADDGVSVQLDDSEPYVIREWHEGSATYCAEVFVTEGIHKLRIEYFEHQGGALIQFSWERVRADPRRPN